MKLRTLLLATLMAAMVASGLVVSVDQGVGRASTVVHFGAVGPVDVTVWGQTSLTPTTMVSLTTEIALTFGLRTDRASLEAHAIAVSDPKSADYGKFDSVATTGARFNASDQALSTIENWFASHNVQIAIDATRSYVTASVPLSVVEQMIGTTYGTYAAAGVPQNLVLLTPTAAVSTLVSPLHEVIDRVAGATALWDTTSDSQSPLAVPPESDLTHYSPSSVSSLQPAFGGTPERTGTFVDGCAAAESVSPLGFPMGLSPAQLRTAYGIDHLWNAGYRGRGARIAVLDFNGYLHSDIDVWRDCFGLAGTPVTDHIVGSPGCLTKRRLISRR
jgi:subtilase family serine protease